MKRLLAAVLVIACLLPLPRVARAQGRPGGRGCRVRGREEQEVDVCLTDDVARLEALLALVPAEHRPERKRVYFVYPSDPAFSPAVRARLQQVEAFSATERPGDVIINAEGRLWGLAGQGAFAACAMAATIAHENAHASRAADEPGARQVEEEVFRALARENALPADAVAAWIVAIRTPPEVAFSKAK